ncbi:MAG TPA: hypothetical protein PLC24_04525 [Myxococcota bacterium]|nr:hypothetical protein [Myxococcota bacterium]
MTIKLQYDGDVRLDRLEDRIRMVGTSPATDVALSLLDELNGAVVAGLSFQGTLRGVKVFSTLAGYVTPAQISSSQTAAASVTERARLAERLLASASSTWGTHIGLLSAEDRIKAWEAVDNLFASVIAAHLHDEVIYAGFRHVDKCEFPPTATATILARRLLTLGTVDHRFVQLIEFLNRNARFPQEMALARACGSRLDFQLQSALMKRSGALLEALVQLKSVDESVTETFGQDFFVDVSGTESREVAELLTKRVLAVKAEWNIRDQFANNYVEYIIGRIDAGAGNPEHAIRVFQQTARGGFASYDSTVFLALLATSEGRQELARQSIQELVSRYAVPLDFSEAFGSVMTAWRRAGGDPAVLQKSFPMEELVELCRASRARIDSEFSDGVEEDRKRATDSFWLGRTERLLAGVGLALEPTDFDASSSPGHDSRLVRLPEKILVEAGIDQMPGLSPIARATFVEAARSGVAASELIGQLFEIADNLKGDFGAMAKLVPAWAYSQSIALGRLEDAIKARNSAGVLTILSQYLELPGVPSDLLATLYERALATADRLSSIEKMLGIGVRFWKAVRGGSGVRILRVMRPAAMKVLSSYDERAAWVAALEAVLDTIPNDETRKMLAEWYLAQKLNQGDDPRGMAASREHDMVVLTCGRLLSGRLGPPFDDAVRAHLRGLVLAGKPFDARHATAQQLTSRIELISEWCEGDAIADRMIVDWFNLWVCSKGGFDAAEYDEMADAAFVAINHVSDAISRRDIAETALDILKVRLDSCRDDRGTSEAVLTRISALSAYVPEASDLVETHREEQKDSKLLFYASVLGGAGIIAVVILLLNFFAC